MLKWMSATPLAFGFYPGFKHTSLLSWKFAMFDFDHCFRGFNLFSSSAVPEIDLWLFPNWVEKKRGVRCATVWGFGDCGL
jgi:hypothetical protein